MRTAALSILMSFLLFAPAARAQAVDVEETMADMQAVMETQQRRFAAMTSVDVAALDSLLAPSLVYTHSTGRVETKAQFLESLRAGTLRYLTIEPTDLDVQLFTDVALITGRADLRVALGGEERDLALRFTEVYVQWEPGGPWQLAAWQSTGMAP